LECPHIDEGSLKFIEETLKIKKYAEAVQEKCLAFYFAIKRQILQYFAKFIKIHT